MLNKMFDKKTEKISVDLDDISSQRLLRTFLMAKKFFPNSKIEVRLSPSHSGYHVIIHKKISALENIFWRAMLDDDEVRIVLSLKKIFMNPDAPVDIAFDIKGGGKAEVIDLEKILKPYKKRIERILKRWDGSVDGDVSKIAEEIKGRLPIRERWVFAAAFKGSGLKESIKDWAVKEYEKNNVAHFGIFQSYYPDNDFIFTRYFKNEDDAELLKEKFEKKFKIKGWTKKLKV